MNREQVESILESEKVSCVYFIQNTNTGVIKIGYSEKPLKRLKTLQSHTADKLKLLEILPDHDRRDEKELHQKFVDSNIFGEWFKPTDKLMKLIHSLDMLNGKNIVQECNSCSKTNNLLDKSNLWTTCCLLDFEFPDLI